MRYQSKIGSMGLGGINFSATSRRAYQGADAHGKGNNPDVEERLKPTEHSFKIDDKEPTVEQLAEMGKNIFDDKYREAKQLGYDVAVLLQAYDVLGQLDGDTEINVEGKEVSVSTVRENLKALLDKSVKKGLSNRERKQLVDEIISVRCLIKKNVEDGKINMKRSELGHMPEKGSDIREQSRKNKAGARLYALLTRLDGTGMVIAKKAGDSRASSLEDERKKDGREWMEQKFPAYPTKIYTYDEALEEVQAARIRQLPDPKFFRMVTGENGRVLFEGVDYDPSDRKFITTAEGGRRHLDSNDFAEWLFRNRKFSQRTDIIV
jgi:hypothetical protein